MRNAMSHKRKKVVIFGLVADTNLGDLILSETTKYLYSSVYPEWDYEIIDLRGRRYNTDGKVEIVAPISPFDQCCSIIGKIFKKLLYYCNKKLWEKCDFYLWKTMKIGERNLYSFLKINCLNTDLIIFAGGGIIEYEHYNSYRYIYCITKIAEKYKIPIIYNAVGFNGQLDKKDYRGKMLYDSLNNEYVKNITVREYPDMMSSFFSENRNIDQVCDPAVWSCEAFNIKRCNHVPLIGINIIRPRIFPEFGYNIKREDLLELFVDIINKLEKRYKWQLFTNGVVDDYAFGKHILKKIKRGEEYLVKRALNPIAFLTQLSNYRGCVCTRMHASICAYSLKIPAVSILWNAKIKSFYNAIGYPERCFDAVNLSADKIVFGMIEALEEQYDISKYNAFRETIISSIKDIDRYIT